MERDYVLNDYISNQFCKINNPLVLEDLGEIDYIFSDKTGTLTKNKLSFKEMSIINAQEQIQYVI
jgi:phospholipid-translocating ATPase